MTAREEWRRTYRAARLAWLDPWSREVVRRHRFGRRALRIVDDRPQARAFVAVAMPLVAAKAMRWLRSAL